MTLNLYKVHQFTTPGNSSFVVTNAPAGAEVEYLIVAGGGGGGGRHGGGGGGGGVLAGRQSGISATSYPVVVGVGGEGRTFDERGLNGGNSSAFGLTSIGGGGGGSWDASRAGSTGGSGGGASYVNITGSVGTPGQGRQGGNSLNDSNAAGGGGARQSGANGSIFFGSGGKGGFGFRSSILGTAYYFGGGGGGGSWEPHFAGGNGGLGGGGGGGKAQGGRFIPGKGGGLALNSGQGGNVGRPNAKGGTGGANTGGGGGGGGATTPNAGYTTTLYGGGNGGSGIVVIRYPSATIKEPSGIIEATGGSLDHVFDGAGIYKIHRFASQGTFTFSVTNVGQFKQKLKFSTNPNSTFNGVSNYTGVITPEPQDYTVIVGSGGYVDIAYPISALPNNIRHGKFGKFVPTQATGGVESTTTIGGISHKVHTFSSAGNSTFVVSDEGTEKFFEVEVLGAGGGGGTGFQDWAGGGGGGSYIRATVLAKPKTYSVSVGAGGIPQTACNNALWAYPGKGGDSSFDRIVSRGGFGGASNSATQTQTSIGGNNGQGLFNIIDGELELLENYVGGNGERSISAGGAGGANGLRVQTATTTFGTQGTQVGNFTPGNNATGNGNGGGGGPSCQNGHRGGGSGSPGLVSIKYPLEPIN